MKRTASLHIIDRLDRRLGGAMQATLSTCRYLRNAGEEAEAAGTVGPGDLLDHLAGEFAIVKVNRFERSFPGRYSNSSDLTRWLPTVLSRFEVVEIHAIFSAVSLRAAAICRRHGCPYIVRPHGSLDPFDLRKHRWLKRIVGPVLVRPMLAGARAVLLTATKESDRLQTYGARVPRKVLPLPVELSSRAGDGARFRARHGIAASAQVVLFMGRVDYKKGLDLLIPAMGRLRRRNPRLWFVLAGTGEHGYRSLVARWLDAHGLRNCTTETGFIAGDDKLDALAAADVFALPSRNENFGIVNVEAMHAGLPLLISDEVYIGDEVARAGAGMVCRLDPNSVEATLGLLLSDGVDRRLMGVRGRELVQSRYRPEAAIDSLVRLYKEIRLGHVSRDGQAGAAEEVDR